MNKDRTEICRIISDMMDNPDKYGIYNTIMAYTRLEQYIRSVRAEAVGWTHAYCGIALDVGIDPRSIEVPNIFEQAENDLN